MTVPEVYQSAITATTKICPQCGQTLPLDAFGLRTRARLGRRSECRVCRSALSRTYRQRETARLVAAGKPRRVVYATDTERFWAHVRKGTAPDACWLWTGRLDGTGYGYMWLNRKNQRVHRIAWSLAHGPIPPEMVICHHCDTPSCCRPSHLFLGTYAVNNADRDAKGRQAKGARSGARLHPESRARGERNGARLHPERLARGERNGARLHPERMPRGENHPHAKLTADDVQAIRDAFARGQTQTALARQYGMRQTTISNICAGKSWAWLPLRERP